MNFKSLTEYYRRKSKENLPDLVEEFKNLTLKICIQKIQMQC